MWASAAVGLWFSDLGAVEACRSAKGSGLDVTFLDLSKATLPFPLACSGAGGAAGTGSTGKGGSTGSAGGATSSASSGNGGSDGGCFLLAASKAAVCASSSLCVASRAAASIVGGSAARAALTSRRRDSTASDSATGSSFQLFGLAQQHRPALFPPDNDLPIIYERE